MVGLRVVRWWFEVVELCFIVWLGLLISCGVGII